MAPEVGIEPTTYGLTVRRSTAELHWNCSWCLYTESNSERRITKPLLYHLTTEATYNITMENEYYPLIYLSVYSFFIIIQPGISMNKTTSSSSHPL